jgi:hypothetical protein
MSMSENKGQGQGQQQQQQVTFLIFAIFFSQPLSTAMITASVIPKEKVKRMHF